MSKQPNAKKKRTDNRIGRRIAIGAFSAIVIVVTVIVILAMHFGVGGLDSATGKVVPDEEKIRAFEEASAQIETEEPEETSDPYLEAAEQTLSAMTLEEKVYQLFITSPDELTGKIGTSDADDRLLEPLQEMPIGGLIFYEANVYSADQLQGMMHDLKENVKIPMFFGIDAEPGNDEGLNRFGVTDAYEDASVYGENSDAQSVRAMAKKLGTDMRMVGFNLNFAPVADVLVEPANREIGNRSFGADPITVSSLVGEMIDGLHESGVITCTKHFPGLASTANNTNHSTAISERTMEDLRQAELPPFDKAIEVGTDMIMVSHLQLPSVVEGDLPVSLSPVFIQEILRGELGYQGVIITDSLQKKAITSNYSSAEAAVMALQAGCDMILMPDDLSNAAEGVLSAINNGELSEDRINESVLRILVLKGRYGLLPQ